MRAGGGHCEHLGGVEGGFGHPDGPHAHGNTARQVVDDPNAEGSGKDCKTTPTTASTTPSAPATGVRLRGNGTARNTGRKEHSDPMPHAKGRMGP